MLGLSHGASNLAVGMRATAAEGGFAVGSTALAVACSARKLLKLLESLIQEIGIPSGWSVVVPVCPRS